MKKLIPLITLIFASTNFSSAFDFRIGPKVGLGIGTVAGLGNDTAEDANIIVGIPVGVLTQFDFGKIGIDTGLNYQTRIYGFETKKDIDSNGIEDKNVSAALMQSLEIPFTVYYKLDTSRGFFKFGGGAAFEYYIGKVKYESKVTVNNVIVEDVSERMSYSDAGLKQYDFYIVGHFGYQFGFDSWALSLDLQPKVSLIDKSKDSTVDGSWRNVIFDFGVGFLF